MSNTFTISTAVNTLGKSITSQTVLTGEGGSYIDTTEAGAATNKEYTIAFPYQRLLGFVALCSKDCVLEFNDSTTGVPTIALAAGKVFFFDSTQPYANPFTANVTKVYATVASGYDLQIYPIIDPTP